MEISSPLLALPTELLLQIIDYVSANDLDAFTSTCERLRATAAERLATHRKLKKEYGNVQLGSNDNINYRNPISFLHAALKDPGLATYPLTLTLAEYKPDLWPNHTEQNTLNDAILQETDGFQACLLTSPFIPAKDLQKWHTAIMSHDASPIYAFPLTTLPNIQKLTYDGVVLNTRYIDYILRSLASASSTSGINNSKLLDKLSNVQVRDLPRKGSYGDRELRPPHLRSLHPCAFPPLPQSDNEQPDLANLSTLTPSSLWHPASGTQPAAHFRLRTHLKSRIYALTQIIHPRRPRCIWRAG